MCLCMIDKRYKSSQVIREAWKVFRFGQDNELLARHRYDQFPIGVWLRAEKKEVSMSDPTWPMSTRNHSEIRKIPIYQSGFHAFQKRETAEIYAEHMPVRRVFVRGIRLVGREYNNYTNAEPIGPVWVADEMFIPAI